MELHRIIAPDASKATAEALRLYGRDALILSTRRLENAKTEVIVATEAPGEPAEPAPRSEGKAFKAAFEAQLAPPSKSAEAASAFEPSPGEAKAAFLRAHVSGATEPASGVGAPDPVAPAPIPDPAPATPEGLALLNAIHEELARLRSEVGALKEARSAAKHDQDRDRLSALGLAEGPLETVLSRLAAGDLPPLPKLSEGAASQARWLARLLAPRQDEAVLRGRHILRAEDSTVQAELAVALAAAAEQQQGPGSTLLVAVGRNPGHWRTVSQAALTSGLQVLWAADSPQLANLLAHDGLKPALCLLLPASGEQADALRQIPALAKVPRHQILPADRLNSPFLGTLLGGSETDTVMVQRFHKDVPLRHFVATMLQAGKPLSVLSGDDSALDLGEAASLKVMAAWAEKSKVPPASPERTPSPWPLALHG